MRASSTGIVETAGLVKAEVGNCVEVPVAEQDDSIGFRVWVVLLSLLVRTSGRAISQQLGNTASTARRWWRCCEKEQAARLRSRRRNVRPRSITRAKEFAVATAMLRLTVVSH